MENKMERIDFNVITPCGECCIGSKKKNEGFCQGCIESGGNDVDGKHSINCPNCGKLKKDDIQIYSESLRKQNFKLLPIMPVCKNCGTEVEVKNNCSGGNIIVLNGTSGSGKSTIAELLAEKGFLAIDGDCVIQTVRHKNKRKQYEWDELIEEIGHEIDILSMFSNNIVISHIVLPEDFNKYLSIFESRNIKYKIFLLKPQYRTAVERCGTRTCHAGVTPEYWIKHFYDLLEFDERVVIVDNTDMTAEDTADYILNDFC